MSSQIPITWPSTAAEVPACIDQWTAQVGDLLGRDSATYAELCKLYDTACREVSA